VVCAVRDLTGAGIVALVLAVDRLRKRGRPSKDGVDKFARFMANSSAKGHRSSDDTAAKVGIGRRQVEQVPTSAIILMYVLLNRKFFGGIFTRKIPRCDLGPAGRTVYNVRNRRRHVMRKQYPSDQRTRIIRVERDTARRIKTVASHHETTIAAMVDRIVEPALSRLEKEATTRMKAGPPSRQPEIE
jgi:hypothetical protein